MRRFSKRDKVADLLHHAISNAFFMELEDSDLRWVTITEIRLNKDLSVARIFYSVVDQKLHRDRATEALEKNRWRLKGYLGKHLRLKQVPELRFTYDETVDKAARIEELIRSIHEEDNGTGS